MSSDVILSVENVSKLYRLGTVGTGTFGGDVQRFWKTKVLGQEDPFLKIGQTNDRASKEKAEFVWALQDINFEVKRGEVLGIIGKNGAGKSTLLKLLSRITAPTTGSIRSAGRMASLLEVGTGFHPELTGRENIFLNGAILGMTKREIQSKFDEIVDFSGCELYLDTPVKRYSSGMTVRLGFAVAAFLDPEILVVDEVLAVGDAEFQKKAIGKMKEVSEGDGRAVLFVSHNMDSIKALCPKSLLLNNGTIEIISDTQAVLNKYFDIGKSRLDRNIDDLVINEQVKITNFAINKNSKTKIYIDQGDELEFEFTIQSNLDFEQELLFNVGFNSTTDSNATSFGNFYQKLDVRFSKGITRIKLLLGECILNCGEYRLDWQFITNELFKNSAYCEDAIRLNVNRSNSNSKIWRKHINATHLGAIPFLIQEIKVK